MPLNVTVQVLVPVHAPVQAVKTEPGPGVACRLTDVPEPNDAVQALVGQLMPAGTLTTEPVPVPDRVTPTGISRAKLATIALSEFISKAQVFVPVHWAALQPANTDPGSATAVSVTVVPELTCAEHVAPQLIAAGLLVTVPVPLPALATESVTGCGGGGAKFAVTA